MNRNRVIDGIVVLLLVALVTTGGWWFVRFIHHSGHVGQKTLVTRLGYCGVGDSGPCILSFSQIGDGKMRVEVLVPSSTFPDFYLTISREEQRYRYECEESEDSSTHIYCIGAEMFPGELLQFSLVATKDEQVLAEGQFAILGLLLSTPMGETLDATIPTEPPSGSPTPAFVLRTPTPTATLPSYPNPTSYPNPSHPNP